MRYREMKSDMQPYIRRVMLNMSEIKAELNEHRYYLEEKVETRTEHLMKRILFLESCNATLCEKLALAKKELAAFRSKPDLPNKMAESAGVKLYLMNTPDVNATGGWAEHLTAA